MFGEPASDQGERVGREINGFFEAFQVKIFRKSRCKVNGSIVDPFFFEQVLKDIPSLGMIFY
jgi:hypothetical protein